MSWGRGNMTPTNNSDVPLVEADDGVPDARPSDAKTARAEMLERHESVTAATPFVRSDGDSIPMDVRTRPVDRSFDREFHRHEAAHARLDKLHPPRPPVADISGFKLLDCVCMCCSKSFRTLHAKDFCSKTCTDKGAKVQPVPVQPQRTSICQHCGDQFTPKRIDARYCPGGACQKAAERKQIAELSRTTLCEAA
jgi:hypothetical protein